ncbi:unnamed protein product [Vicia faba]|uniref:Uncharacterized protein n=1 Tax=Vicia faba TaxID=3906 RepID=A0AAV0ZHL2_VICFA|nr:unnamed protein product [Vicia faba]
MDDILEAPKYVYKPLGKIKVVASEVWKETHKPQNKKDMELVQNEVKEVVSSTILMPIMSISVATRRTLQNTTASSVISAPVKKLGKMILPLEEEDEEDDQPLNRKSKEVKKQNKALEKPSDVEFLKQQAGEVEVVAESILKNVGETYEAGETPEVIVGTEITDEATPDVAEAVNQPQTLTSNPNLKL